MSPIRVVLVVLAGVLVFAAPLGAKTAQRLNGTVGPTFTISLKKGTSRVTTLPRGRYTFVVSDRSDFHNFRLTGPGIARNLTGVAFVGTSRPVALTLRPGRYTFFCVPHPVEMRGTFRVR
jgi:hypothetical protein